MKLMTVFLLGMLLLGLTACESYRQLGERTRKEREAREQLREIRELYDECLQRKAKDRRVDCSGYQTAIEGKPAK